MTWPTIVSATSNLPFSATTTLEVLDQYYSLEDAADQLTATGILLLGRGFVSFSEDCSPFESSLDG